MRISDWSSDVCSSDLPLPQCQSLARFSDTVRDTQSSRFSVLTRGAFIIERGGKAEVANVGSSTTTDSRQSTTGEKVETSTDSAARTCPPAFEREPQRSEERRVGKGGGSTCRSRWSAYH